MYRISNRFVFAFLASAGLCVFSAGPVAAQQGQCAGKGSGSASASTTSSGTAATAAPSTNGGRIALSSSASQITVSSAQVQSQINQLRVTQVQFTTGAVTLPANSTVSASQVQSQLQVHINQLSVLRNQLVRSGR